jgi:hypothetical protein
MLLFIQPFVTKSPARKSVSRYFGVEPQATVKPKAVSASVRDEPHRDEYHVSGLDHYIDSRLAGELFRID